jgi:hypothetical protein
MRRPIQSGAAPAVPPYSSISLLREQGNMARQ